MKKPILLIIEADKVQELGLIQMDECRYANKLYMLRGLADSEIKNEVGQVAEDVEGFIKD